ncbi:hypothetical protein [Ekhidna sp.]
MSQDKMELQSLSQISEFVDTLNVKPNHVRISVTWLSDTIEIRSLIHPVKYNLELMRKLKKDSTFTPTIEEEERLKSIMKTGAQNCYSNALQRYFKFNKIEAEMLFNEDVGITRKTFETIVNNTFIKTNQFSTKNKKHFKDQLDDGTLIVFRNKSNWMNHAFYYENGVFYSKNGASMLKEYSKMKDIFKKYWDTPIVEFYEMNENKVSNFLIESK